MEAKEIQKAFEKFMKTGQDQESVTRGLQHHLGDKSLDFQFVSPHPMMIKPTLMDNGDGTFSALVTIQVNISKIEDENDEG